MKEPNLTIAFMLVVVTLLGCKENDTKPTPKPISEKLAFNVMELDHESIELAIQVGWLRGRLESCLFQLERKVGLEPKPFDWIEASGFPNIKRDPNRPERYALEPTSIYVPYPTIKKSGINIERYTDPEHLSIYIEKQLSARRAHMLGMDKYIKHLEERLKRLEEHLNK